MTSARAYASPPASLCLTVKDDVSVSSLGAEAVLVGPRGRFVFVDHVTSLIIPHLATGTTLGELADDAAWALSLPSGAVLRHLSEVVRYLLEVELLASTDESPLAMSWTANPDSPSEVVSPEPLGGGMREYRAEVTLMAGPGGKDTDLVDELLTGRKSLVEAIPPDSCLGSRLRLAAAAERPALVLGTPDGPARVLCTDQRVEDILQSYRVSTGRGPVHAIVAGPLKGVSPPRVYDSRGIRVGRPRTATEAAVLVGHVLREAASPGYCSPEHMVLRGKVVVLDGRVVVIPPEIAGLSGLERQLLRRGALVASQRRFLINPQASAFLEPPALFGDDNHMPLDDGIDTIIVPRPSGALAPLSSTLEHLLSETKIISGASPTSWLVAASEVIQQARVRFLRPPVSGEALSAYRDHCLETILSS